MWDSVPPEAEMEYEEFREKWFEIILAKNERLTALERQVSELKDGTCRFNCRTGRSMWMEGFRYAMQAVGLRSDNTAAGEAYDHWKDINNE